MKGQGYFYVVLVLTVKKDLYLVCRIVIFDSYDHGRDKYILIFLIDYFIFMKNNKIMH